MTLEAHFERAVVTDVTVQTVDVVADYQLLYDFFVRDFEFTTLETVADWSFTRVSTHRRAGQCRERVSTGSCRGVD